MSRIRDPDWENDENLKADILKYVLQNLTRREVLDFLGRDYPQYAWSLPTLSRRMAHFGVKYVDYETDLKVVEKAVKEETSGPTELREQHHLAVPRGLVYGWHVVIAGTSEHRNTGTRNIGTPLNTPEHQEQCEKPGTPRNTY